MSRVSRFMTVVYTILFTVALVMLVSIYLQQTARADPGVPFPGTVVGVATRQLPTTALTAFLTQTKTTNVFDPILSQTKFYHSADVFITGQITAGAHMTATVQLSADGRNWVDAYYIAILGSTPTKTLYKSFFTTTSSDYYRIPVAGEYLQVVVQNTGNVTPTIQLTLRND